MLQLQRGGAQEGRMSIGDNQKKTWKNGRIQKCKNAAHQNLLFYSLEGEFKTSLKNVKNK